MMIMAPQTFKIRYVAGWLLRWLILIPLAASYGCSMLDDPDAEGVVVVGSRHIGADELKRDIAFVSPGLKTSALRKADAAGPLLDLVIERYLIMEYAAEAGVSVSEEDVAGALKGYEKKDGDPAFRESILKEYLDAVDWEKRLRERLLVEKVLKQVMAEVRPPGYEDIKSYFEANRRVFHQPEMLRFRQIVTRTGEEAQALKNRLLHGEEMGELAREFSIAPEAENRGEVGWVGRGELHESMEEPLFSTGVGKITEVVKTPYGYHLFQVLAHRSEAKSELPEVYAQIESELLKKRRVMYLDQWLKELRERFVVKIHYDKLSAMGFSINES